MTYQDPFSNVDDVLEQRPEYMLQSHVDGI